MRWKKRKRGSKKRKLWNIALVLGVVLVLVRALSLMPEEKIAEKLFGEEGKKALFSHLWNCLYPAPVWEGEAFLGGGGGTYVEEVRKLTQAEEDPAYRTAKAAEAFFQEHHYLEIYGGEETGGLSVQETEEEGEVPASGTAYPGKLYSLAQLEDYDFLMKNFYSVHTSTTADRELMDVKKLLSRDFRLDKGSEEEGTADSPQILIYHTHSQEAFADSNEGETIVAVGDYLAQCLTERGFSVYHDSSAYDVREGKLDRNKAYQYALEGLTGILEEHPSIQVVIDLHRDGVGADTHLVTEVKGKPTAQIMFFNGMSQTPEGPIPYLENPYREDNLAFSLQLQLKASAWYPGLTRKIYLKGLRYNQHLRPCSCLVEVGAQTNTYQEAKNAMEPLADIFTMVLLGKSALKTDETVLQ